MLECWRSIKANMECTIYNYWVNSFDHVFKLLSCHGNEDVITILSNRIVFYKSRLVLSAKKNNERENRSVFIVQTSDRFVANALHNSIPLPPQQKSHKLIPVRTEFMSHSASCSVCPSHVFYFAAFGPHWKTLGTPDLKPSCTMIPQKMLLLMRLQLQLQSSHFISRITLN